MSDSFEGDDLLVRRGKEQIRQALPVKRKVLVRAGFYLGISLGLHHRREGFFTLF